MDVVGEDPLAVDLDDREPLPVAGLEVRIARDVDLLERETELGTQLLELRAGPVAQVTSGRVVEGDRYG